MYPPVGLGQVRVNAKRDLTLAGGRLSIPAGTALWVPHHAMHNAKHNWDRPEEFLPGARLALANPLSSGLRQCVAQLGPPYNQFLAGANSLRLAQAAVHLGILQCLAVLGAEQGALASGFACGPWA